MRRRTPQEKKQLSLEKDRRNIYGEAPTGAKEHSSPKEAPKSRKPPLPRTSLPSEPVTLDAYRADEVESALRREAPQVWQKCPDGPLKEVIAKKQRKRATPRAKRSRIVFAKTPKT